MSVYIPVSIGELWDKYTILLIKQRKIHDENKLAHVNTEKDFLESHMNTFLLYKENPLFIELQDTNERLWDIEDALRIKESDKEFDAEFIELARSVYFVNDKRAAIKKDINIQFGSAIHEVKEYVDYKK